MNEIKEYTEKVFEDIKHIDEIGNEYWYARELMSVLGYSKWENFNKVIEKAIVACQNSSINYKELSEKEYNELSEDEKRLYRRNQARKGNFNLNKTAVNSGVKDLARFHNAGYKGLYNGETADDIFKRKKLRYREDILDNMGSEELADNIFRIAQTGAKLKRDNVDNEYTANSVHYEVGKEVRNSIKRLGGTMPEDLLTPEKSLKELEKDSRNQLTNNKL